MSAYRDELRPAASCEDRLGFPNARVRVGVDRFELSFGVAWKRFAVFCVLVAWGCAFLAPIVPVVAGVALLMVVTVGLVHRRHLVVTRYGSWGQITLLGMRIKRCALGMHPRVDNLGYDWEELGIYPVSEAERAGLHDGERFVLVEWTSFDGREARDGAHLQAIARAEILRLHGDAPTA